MAEVPMDALPDQQEVVSDKTDSKNTTPENSHEELLAQREAQIANLEKKEKELQAQKEHWREKYERDIANKASSPEPSSDDSEVYSDEGLALKKELDSMRQQFEMLQSQSTLQQLYQQYPALKDKSAEFDEYRNDSDNAGVRLDKLAKLFLVDNDLLSDIPKRKGLEKPTAGEKVAPKSGLTEDEVKSMRENQPRRYEKLLRDGKLKPEDIRSN